MNKTIEERKEDAKVSAQAGVDEDLEDVSAAGDVVPRGAADMGEGAETIITSQEHISRLITAGSYLAGMAFKIGAIMKFK